jgi:hypothetical protein
LSAVEVENAKSNDPGRKGKAKKLAESGRDSLGGPRLGESSQTSRHVAVRNLGPGGQQQRADADPQ